MKRQIIIPVLTAILGVLIGYFFFGGESETREKAEQEQIWTCSMHPQIRKNEPGECPICQMELIPLDKAGGNPLVFEMTEEAVRISNIQTTRIGSSGATDGNLVLSGKIKTDETTASSLVTHIPGRIEKLYVSFEGERVSKGQRIARIYSPDMITAQRELLEAFKLSETNPELLEAAKNKMRYWKISNDKINEIIKSKHVVEQFDIYAEYSGVIAKKKVNVGDYLQKGEVLFDVQNLNKLWVVFDVYETDLSRIHLGAEIEFKTPSLPGETFRSKVAFVDPFIDSQTRTASVRLEIKNSKGLLKPDMFVSGTLESAGKGTGTQALTVPKSAVLWTGERSVVYIKLPDVSPPSFEYREVHIGASLGDSYEVLSGLRHGDEVVTNGAFVIDAAAQLNNKSSMINGLLVHNEITEMKPEISHHFTGVKPSVSVQLDGILHSYVELKEAFVASNSQRVREQASALIKDLDKVPMSELDEEAHHYWMAQKKQADEQLRLIIGSQSIKEQRKYFTHLSVVMVEINESFQQGLVVQFCPMANKKEGGYWLSSEKKIRNPYFGDSMLSCGEVVHFDVPEHSASHERNN